MNIKKIEDYFRSLRKRPIRTIVFTLVLIVVVLGGSYIKTYWDEKAKQKANAGFSDMKASHPPVIIELKPIEPQNSRPEAKLRIPQNKKPISSVSPNEINNLNPKSQPEIKGLSDLRISLKGFSSEDTEVLRNLLINLEVVAADVSLHDSARAGGKNVLIRVVYKDNKVYEDNFGVPTNNVTTVVSRQIISHK